MRLLALVSGSFGASGAIARYNRDLMTALAQSAHLSEIAVLPQAGDPAAAMPAKVRLLAPSPGRAACHARALALAAERCFDAVLCDHLAAVPLAAAIAGLRRMPLWVQIHGAEAWQRPGAVQRLSLSSATLVTAGSRCARAQLLSWSDVAPHRIRVLPGPEHCSVGASADGRIDRPGERVASAESGPAGTDASMDRHRTPDAADAARAFSRFAAHVDALVGTLVRRQVGCRVVAPA